MLERVREGFKSLAMAIKLVVYDILSATPGRQISASLDICRRFVSTAVLAKDTPADSFPGSIESGDNLQVSRDDDRVECSGSQAAVEVCGNRLTSKPTAEILFKHGETSVGFPELLQVRKTRKKDLANLLGGRQFLLRPTFNENHQRLLKFLSELGLNEQKANCVISRVPKIFDRIGYSSTWKGFTGSASDYGLKKIHMKALLEKNPALLSSFLSGKLVKTIRVLKNIGLHDECVCQILHSHPSVLKQNREATLISRVQYWQSMGLDRQSLMKLVAIYPAILNVTIEKSLKPKVEYFQNFGLSKDMVARIFQRIPYVVSYSIDRNIKPKIEYLQGFGLIKEDICKMLRKHPHFLRCSIEHSIKPTIQFLLEHGLQGKALVRMLIRQPQILGRSAKRSLMERMKLVENLGLKRESNKLVTAILVTSCLSLKTLEGRHLHLVSLGLSEDEVYKILRSQPEIYGKSIKDIDHKVEYLIKVLDHPVSALVKIPVYLLYSLEKRIKPRYELLSWLHSIGVLQKIYSLSTILTMSEMSFSRKFVRLHPDGATLYPTNAGQFSRSTCMAESGHQVYRLK